MTTREEVMKAVKETGIKTGYLGDYFVGEKALEMFYTIAFNAGYTSRDVLSSSAMQARIEELEESEANLRSQLYQERQDHGNNVKRIKDIAYVMLNTINNERDALQADNERLKIVVDAARHFVSDWDLCRSSGEWPFRRLTELRKALDATLAQKFEAQEALAATPKKSLAMIRNQVRDECIEIIACNLIGFADDDEDLNNMIAKIRAMKEPE